MRALFLATALATTLALPATAQSERAALGSGVAASDRADTAERPIRFAAATPTSGVLAIAMAGAGDLTRVPPALRDAVGRAVAAADFKADRDRTFSLYGIGGYDRILLVGVGAGALDSAALADFGGRAAQETRSSNAPVAILTEGLSGGVADAAAHVALGAGLGQYRFDRLKSGVTAPPLQPLTIVGAGEAVYTRDFAGVVDGARMARDLIALPSNAKHPESFVEAARARLAGVPNVRITVLDEAQMRQLNMGSLLSVSQGSRRPGRLMLVEYRGAGNTAPIALVGKGITFDSGGISLKPGAGMAEMKGDMSGAAAAIGGVYAAARRGARANVIGVAALAENMPGDNASRPGDVVRTMNGQTIEIISTDAEGRMVLADANQYVIDRYKPVALVNIATLTGAIVTALGDEYAGLFARDEALAAKVQAASTRSGEPVWRMPLHPNYQKEMSSPVADIANSGPGGAGAGRGAHFISFLTPQPTPWAHIDMAGVDGADESMPTIPKGPRGFGVRLFDALVREYEGTRGE
ncbi:leucyl aminopeptidase family protein [Sphingomonas sp.]|uniref:leucyl aminopeptidase family protein n=1 Tax=Sphingomonas sp. TaxID=28214 RepID=UPI002DD69552|nr:leucyl aminopeptidase [Sphingomonas sp.]